MWVIATLASLAGLVIFLLCVPLDMRLHMDVYGKPKFSFKLTWLFGLIVVLFNPIVPIHLTKEIWRPIDLASAIIFGLSILFLSTPGKKRS